jgi:hypothetical protein
MKLFLALLLSLSAAAWAGGRAVTIIPLNGKAITLSISGKDRDYYRLTQQSPLKVQVDGPGKLTITSRLILGAGNADAEKYTILVMEGKNVIKEHATQTDKSEATLQGSNEPVGKSRKVSVKLLEGSFTYAITLAPGSRDAAVRFTLDPEKGKKRLVAIEPLSYDRIVTAKINESLVAYFVASKDRPVQLRVVGPTKVEVNARLNYDQRMQGDQKYSLAITEGEEPVVQKTLQTSKSVGMTYEDWREVVPGKPNSLILAVPAGEHTYKVSLGESVARSVSLKFAIPKKDLKNE